MAMNISVGFVLLSHRMLCRGDASPVCFESQTLVQSVMSAGFFFPMKMKGVKEKENDYQCLITVWF